jgi:hypothetical protein
MGVGSLREPCARFELITSGRRHRFLCRYNFEHPRVLHDVAALEIVDRLMPFSECTARCARRYIGTPRFINVGLKVLNARVAPRFVGIVEGARNAEARDRAEHVERETSLDVAMTHR